MLIAYTNAIDLIRALRPVVAEVRLQSADLADQLERAATSVAHNRHGRGAADPRSGDRTTVGPHAKVSVARG